MKTNGRNMRASSDCPTPFQEAAMKRLSRLLVDHGIPFEQFCFNNGAYWMSFTLNETEHTLAIYADTLNILAGSELYENYLRAEFRSPEVLLESFARRLERLLREGRWELPEEDQSSSIIDHVKSLFRRCRL